MRDVVRENGFVCTLIAFLPLLTIALCLAVMVAAQQQHLPRRAALKPVARSEFFVNQTPAHIQERNENERTRSESHKSLQAEHTLRKDVNCLGDKYSNI